MAAVNNAANNEAFQRLSEIFDYEESVSPLEVEILPKALSSSSSNEVLRDGHCIGIPKAMLVSAFVAARCLLFGGRVHAGDDGDRGSLPDEVGQCSRRLMLQAHPLKSKASQRGVLASSRSWTDTSSSYSTSVQQPSSSSTPNTLAPPTHANGTSDDCFQTPQETQALKMP